MPRGRRHTSDETAASFLYLRVTARQLADLHDVARENGITLSEVIREAVFEWAAEHAERRAVSAPAVVQASSRASQAHVDGRRTTRPIAR